MKEYGKYIKMTTSIGEVIVIKIKKMFLDEIGEPYKCYCNRIKVEPKAYFYEDAIVYFDEERTKYEAISEEEYNEFAKNLIDKILDLK